MRVLMTTTGHAGHLLPLVPFALALGRAGNDVRIAAPRSFRPSVEREGLRCEPFDDPPDGFTPGSTGLAALGNDQADELVIADMFGRHYARTALPGLLDIIDGWRPDVIVRESLELASCVAAECRRIPLVRVGVCLTTAEEAVVVRAAAAAVDELRGRCGLPGDPAAERIRTSPYLTLSPRLLDGSASPEPWRTWRFRERRGSPAPAPVPGTGPLVYLSFGTVAGHTGFFPELHRAAITALATLPVRVLVTTGDAGDPAELAPLPDNVRVQRWVVERDVIPHAAAVISHGGAGSTLRALAHGVPMAVVPLLGDQPRNARRVVELGAGLSLPEFPTLASAIAHGPSTVAGWLGPAVRALLDDPRHRRGALRVAGAVRALKPVDAAAEVLYAIAGQLRSRTRKA